MAKQAPFQFQDVHGFVEDLFAEDVHAKRVYSLANATLGVMDERLAGWPASTSRSRATAPIGA